MESVIYKRKLPLLLFLTPAFLFLAVFLYYPFLQTAVNTLLNIGGLGRPAAGVNAPLLLNYRRVLNDPELRTAVKNTLSLVACTAVFQVGIALVLALLVAGLRQGAGLFRTVYFLPIVISATALGLMFNLIFLYRGGMVNQLLLAAGTLDTQVQEGGRLLVEWLDWKDQDHFLATMFIPIIWQYVGFYFVIILTGLDSIPAELYEAAALDGAGSLQRLRSITLPQLRPVIATCLVLAVTGALKTFDLPWVMFGAGMPQNKGWLLGTYMYDQTFNRMNVDYGSTVAVLMVVLGVVLSRAVGKILRTQED